MRAPFWSVVASLVLLATGSARGQAPTLLRVGVENDAAAIAVQRARDAGDFARAGIAVDVVALPGSAAGETAIVNGTLEIAAASSTVLAIAHDRSEAFSLIAAADVYRSDRPDAALIVPRASTLARGRDFSGKAIGVPVLGDLASFAARAWADRDRAGNVQLVEVAPGDVPAALDAGRIAGAVLAEPALSRALESGKYRIAARPFDAIAPRFIAAAYYARTDWILANRDAVDRFAAVLRQADGSAVDPAQLQPVIALAAHYQVIAKAFPAAQMIYPSALPPPAPSVRR